MESATDRPLVTVLMPCYNAMPYLSEALESIMQQTYTNLEILCINDGSSDETPEVLERYAAQDKRIRVVHNETNLKLIATLNKGIELARGEYIARMDADDISKLNRIEILLGELIEKNADVVSCNYEFIDDNGNFLRENYLKCHKSLEVKLASYFFSPIGHALAIFKSDVLREFPFSEEEVALHSEDYELWTRLIQKNKKLINSPQILYTLRINPNSVSRKYETLQFENFLVLAHRHIESLLSRKIDIQFARIVVNRFHKVSSSEILSGFKLIDEIYETVCREKKTSRLQEIKEFQKIDILLQAIKKAPNRLKVWLSFRLMRLVFPLLFRKNLWLFIKRKFN